MAKLCHLFDSDAILKSFDEKLLPTLALSLSVSIPIFSILSSDSLIPAVSIILKGIPDIEICSSIVSLVVPSISVTIALSSFKNSFNASIGIKLPQIWHFFTCFVWSSFF